MMKVAKRLHWSSEYWSDNKPGLAATEEILVALPRYRHGSNDCERIDDIQEWSAVEAVEGLINGIRGELRKLATGQEVEMSFSGKLKIEHQVELWDHKMVASLEYKVENAQ
jgi:hypothetical protein